MRTCAAWLPDRWPWPRRVVPALLALALSGCHNPLAPSAPPAWTLLLPQWSPYVVLQPDDAALAGYSDALLQLTSRGALAGVRIQLFADGRAAPTVALAFARRLDVLGILDDADLFAPDIEGVFDRYYAAYPQVKTFQVGNEVTTSPVRPMAIDQYLDLFLRLYAYALRQHPDVTLVTQAAFGAGHVGADDLAATIKRFQSLTTLPRVILALNVYTPMALMAYAATLHDLAPPYRIWVTETGVADPTGEISYVTQTYPVLGTLPAERIYWYALWAGDTGMDSGFSLITSPTKPPIVPGPLFQLLTK
jgi:hypothetical protein